VAGIASASEFALAATGDTVSAIHSGWNEIGVAGPSQQPVWSRLIPVRPAVRIALHFTLVMGDAPR